MSKPEKSTFKMVVDLKHIEGRKELARLVRDVADTVGGWDFRFANEDDEKKFKERK
jgi:hypothetical protein